MNEQRHHPRYAVELDVEIVGEHVHIKGRSHDLSRGGLCLFVTSPVVVGMTCDLGIALVFSEHQGSEPLKLTATVVWCTAVQGRYQVGLKFIELNAEQKDYLNVFLRYLEEQDDRSAEDEGVEVATGVVKKAIVKNNIEKPNNDQ